MKLATTIAGLTLAVAAVYSTPTAAQEIPFHTYAASPVARCQGSLPVFESLLRKRPLAIQNDSSEPTWIACGFELDAYNADTGGAVMVDAFFTNYSDTAVTLTCSGVTGFEGGANEYVSLSVEIPPHTGNEDGNLFWFEDDFEGGGMGTGLISINCRLPAGVGINDTYVWWVDGSEPV